MGLTALTLTKTTPSSDSIFGRGRYEQSMREDCRRGHDSGKGGRGRGSVQVSRRRVCGLVCQVGVVCEVRLLCLAPTGCASLAGGDAISKLIRNQPKDQRPPAPRRNRAGRQHSSLFIAQLS